MAKRWYIVQAYSNFERKVAEDIRQKVAQKKLEDLFEDVIVPTEKVVEMRRGRKVDAERKFFPGYVLVKMETSTLRRERSSSTSCTMPLNEANGPSDTRTCSPTSNEIEGFGRSTPS